MACLGNKHYRGTEMLKTCISGNHHPVHLHLATAMHLGKEEGRRGCGTTGLDPNFPCSLGPLPLAACK